MSKLFAPFRLRDIEFRNRVFVSPMCQYSAVDGLPNEWHLVHLGSRAVGGAALVMAEATAVTAEGRISPSDIGIWSDAQGEAFAPIARFVNAQGAVPAIQLAHAGRKASTDKPWLGGAPIASSKGGWEPIAPSPLPFSSAHNRPREMTRADIDAVIEAFAHATRRAGAAGFEVIELHAAHGYLLHEFLSPLTNKRTDAYGGDLENRMRFPLEVARAVRECWPAALPMFVRISATDWVDGGWDLAQSIEFARHLRNLGVDLIDCSSAAIVPDAKVPVGPGFQVPFARAIREQADIATGAVGLIIEPFQAEQIVATGQADVVLLARELLRDPYWPLHAAQKLGASLDYWPKQYLRAKP